MVVTSFLHQLKNKKISDVSSGLRRSSWLAFLQLIDRESIL